MKLKILGALVVLETIGLLVLGWKLVDYQTRHDGYEFESQSAMCTFLAQSYLKTQGALVGNEGENWSKAVDVESDLYNLCLTPITEEGLGKFQLKNLAKYQVVPSPTVKLAAEEGQQDIKTSSQPAVSSKKINYKLPEGWVTTYDTDNKIEVGYDSTKYSVRKESGEVDLVGIWSEKDGKPIRLGWNRHVYLTDYSGGSRHSELYKILGVNNPTTDDWKHPDYFGEKNYIVNGWNCLTIDGVSISQYPGAWTYCPISSNQALVIAQEGYGWEKIEEQLGAIKVVR